jgi:hypothetical protein
VDDHFFKNCRNCIDRTQNFRNRLKIKQKMVLNSILFRVKSFAYEAKVALASLKVSQKVKFKFKKPRCEKVTLAAYITLNLSLKINFFFKKLYKSIQQFAIFLVLFWNLFFKTN